MPWKVGDMHVWSVPKPLQRWGDKHAHREENWIELFFDIMFVPMAMALGQAIVTVSENPKDSAEDLAGALCACLLVFGAIHRTWVTFTIYINKFDQNDLISHAAYAGLMVTTAMLGAFALPNQDEAHEPWDVLEHTDKFVCAFVLNQLIIMTLYLYASFYLKEFRAHFLFQALNQAVIAGLFAFSLIWGGTFIMYFIWTFALLLHSVSGYKCTTRIATVPVSVPHITARCGCFVMVLLGESVIQILQADKKRSASVVEIPWFYTSLTLSLWTVFNLALQYFHTQPKDPDRHALSRSRCVGALWFYSHTVLGFSVLTAGVGLELVFKDALEPNLMDVSFLCCGVGSSLLCLVFMRFLHKGKKGSVQRKCAYLFRITVGVVLVCLPLILGGQGAMKEGVYILLIVAVLTAASTSLDYVRRAKSLGAAHQPLMQDGPSDMPRGSIKLVDSDNAEQPNLTVDSYAIEENSKPRLCEM